MTRPTSDPSFRRPATVVVSRLPAPLLALLLVLPLALVLAACSGDGGGRGPAADPSLRSGDPTTLSLRTLDTTLRTGVVSGRVSRDARERTVRAVGRVVDGWIDAAYVGGAYPRRDFRGSFPGFTRGAGRQALADRDLMTNQPIGTRIDGVRPGHRVVVVDVLGAGGHAVGATARVRLAFRTTGRIDRRVVVRARLALSHTDGWQVFAYDVSKGNAA